ncbi:MAG: SDR family NAD(P)-dependent oxidoreductase [Luteibaculaceae bacterium]
MQRKLENKIAIVTGGASGIGKACAEILLINGATVIIADINAEQGEKFCKENELTHFMHTNVTNEDHMKNLFHKVYMEYGRIDILVNNAGVEGEQDYLFDVDTLNWKNVMEINATSIFYALKYASPIMIQQRKGSIINMSSVCGIKGTARLSAYGASKAAVINLTKTAALEYAPYFVRVNAVAPSVVDTPLLNHFIDSSPNPDMMRNSLQQFNPMPGLIPIEAVANTVLFLASDQAEYITGTVIPVDGGLTAR